MSNVRGFWNPDQTGLQVVCTSATRPSAPTAGQQIYETDTSRTLVWNGSTWTPLPGTPEVVTSSTQPTAPSEGQLIYETDTDRYQAYNGAAWVPAGMLQWGSCTASFWQNATLTTTTTTGRYWKFGRYVTVTLRLLAAQAGGANFIMVLFPAAAGVTFTPAANAACGSFVFYDMGAQYRVGTVLAVPTSFGFQFRVDNTNNVLGSTPAITIAVGDIIDMSVTYETTA